METARIPPTKATRNFIREVEFVDVNKAVERVLTAAIPAFGTKAGVCQASLLNVGSPTESLSVRWYGLGQGFRICDDRKPYFENRLPLSRDAERPSLLWEVIDCELDLERKLPCWLKRLPIQDSTSEPPQQLTNCYIADVTSDKARDLAIKIVCPKDPALGDPQYQSSVIVPIIVTPSRGIAKPLLCGVCSIDSSRPFCDIIDSRDSLALFCAQVGLLSSLIESLDLAFYDYLLGDKSVLSQAFYYKKIASVANPRSMALMFCDLNNFKSVNDDHDHDEGDKMIMKFGELLSSHSKACGGPKASWVCRFGGDEFGLLFECEEGQLERLRDWALHLLSSELECSITGCRRHSVSASVGIATMSKIDPPSASDLRARADWAMYAAKRIYKELQRRRTIVCWDNAPIEIDELRKNVRLHSIAEGGWSVEGTTPVEDGSEVPVGAEK